MPQYAGRQELFSLEAGGQHTGSQIAYPPKSRYTVSMTGSRPGTDGGAPARMNGLIRENGI